MPAVPPTLEAMDGLLPAPQRPREAFAARRFRHRNEGTRDHDVLRYVRTWQNMYKPTQLHCNPFASHHLERSEPAACPDTALAAFAQLAALRMAARRCLVTLTCAATEWVLADMGPHSALQYTPVTANDTDRPWIGTSSFPRSESLSNVALEEWRKARGARPPPTEHDDYYSAGLSAHALIIQDLRREIRYQSLDVVRHGPWIRFYCAIPLRDAMGSVLGSITLLDDKPRYGISSDEMTLLEDISDTVVEHLSATVVRARSQRGERLIASLGLFHAGEDSLRDWWLAQDDLRVLNTGRNVDKGTASDRKDRVDAEFGPSAQSGATFHILAPPAADADSSDNHFGDFTSAPSHDDSKKTGWLSDDPDHERAGTPDQRQGFSSNKGGRRTKGRRARGEDFDLASAIALKYESASNLLREALGADGVAFVSAANVTTSSNSKARHPGQDTGESNDSDEIPGKEWSDVDGSDSNVERSDVCKVLGVAFRDPSALPVGRHTADEVNVPERYLQRLIHDCPQGLICHFDQQGQVCSSSDESSSQSSAEENAAIRPRKRKQYQRLAKIFRDVKTLSIYPLWDDGYGRWRSCVFVWNTSVGHYADRSDELSFLKSFGNSMIAEFSRLESVAADMSKSTFISSISHELRSPLHGVLAGAEFLLETPLTNFQLEMTHAVWMAGRMLLDTVNHVLDYSKIQGSAKERTPLTKNGQLNETYSKRSTNTSTVMPTDLARLTEEVIETMVTAQRLPNTGVTSPRSSDGSSTPLSPWHRPQPSASMTIPNVAISLNITSRSNWNVETEAGGWTRILTNLVGNAIKYTKEGHISISLSVGEPLGSGSLGRQRCPIQLSVEDTGIGMSEAFLAHGLYTPFKQENPHAEGTGLGLSIVKQIARAMGAELEIKSKVGKGTVAQLRFLANFTADDAAVDGTFTQDCHLEDLKNWKLGSLDLLAPPRTTPTNTDIMLRRSLCKTFREWLEWDTVESTDVRPEQGRTVFGITEQMLMEWQRDEPELSAVALQKIAFSNRCLLVFGQSMHSVATSISQEVLPETAVFVHQPFGPRKLLRAIASRCTPQVCGEHPTVVSPDPSNAHEVSGERKPQQPYPSVATLSETLPSRSVAQSRSSYATSNHSLDVDMSQDSTLALASTQPSNMPFGLTSSEVLPPWSQGLNNQEGNDTILLVEDNDINLKLLVALVTKLQIPFQCAINGQEAVQIYSQCPRRFFLILMDMSMPVLDGFAATAQIRQEEKKLKLERSYIMALTGVVDPAERQRAFDSGIDDFHNKPIRMKELKTFIQNAARRDHRL